jgi:hypothetical protein
MNFSSTTALVKKRIFNFSNYVNFKIFPWRAGREETSPPPSKTEFFPGWWRISKGKPAVVENIIFPPSRICGAKPGVHENFVFCPTRIHEVKPRVIKNKVFTRVVEDWLSQTSKIIKKFMVLKIVLKFQ